MMIKNPVYKQDTVKNKNFSLDGGTTEETAVRKIIHCCYF